MSISALSVTNVRVVATVFHGVAIISTLFRLYYRHRTLRLWWDDGWAALALVLDAICLACAWLWTQTDTSELLGILPDSVIIVDWLSIFSMTSVVWAARVSILVSIIRIVNPPPRFRKFIIFLAILFCMIWFGILGQKVYYCLVYLCVMQNSVAISQLTTDSFADILLVFIPCRLLWNIRLPRAQRILILSAFLASAAITIVSAIQAVFLFESNFPIVGIIVAHVKAAVALLVCNMLVIVTFVFRLMRNGEDIKLDVALQDNVNHTLNYTTINLDQFASGLSGGISSNLASADQSLQLFGVGTGQELGSIKSSEVSMIVTDSGVSAHRRTRNEPEPAVDEVERYEGLRTLEKTEEKVEEKVEADQEEA